MNDVFSKSSVVIVDDQPIVRLGIRRLLERQGRFLVYAEFATLGEAAGQFAVVKPDVIIADIPASDLADAETLACTTNSRVIAFSNHRKWDFIDSIIKCGCCGFVSKQSPLDELISAVDAVLDGRQWISPCVRQVTLDLAKSSGQRYAGLSSRELEIISLVVRGMSSKQIADQLCIGVKTVESHRYRVFRKLGLSNRAQLVSWAIENKLL